MNIVKYYRDGRLAMRVKVTQRIRSRNFPKWSVANVNRNMVRSGFSRSKSK